MGYNYSQILAPLPIQNSATANNNASNAALPAVVGQTNWLTGFDISGSGPTTASQLVVTVTGLKGGNMSYIIAPIAGVLLNAFGATGGQFSVRYPDPLPASAQNTAITVQVPSFGAGSTGQACNVYGLLGQT